MSELVVFLVLLILGYGFGRFAETMSYNSIRKREEEFGKIILVAAKTLPADLVIRETFLVTGSVVVSVDYFKRFLATLRSIIGGRMISFETLLDRGRREAVLRMKQEAGDKGATMIFNVKIETSSISKGQGSSIGSVEVLAYGAAIVRGEERDIKERIDRKTVSTTGSLVITHVPEATRKKVCQYLAKLSKTSPEKIDAKLSKLPVTLAKNMERDRAEKIMAQLKQAAVEVRFEAK